MEFKDKVALVTGASRGIGYSIAERLAKDGANLILTATSNKIEEVAKEIASKYNVQAIGVAGDISKESDVKSLFKTITEKFGKLDICVNNAGITKDTLSMRMSAEDFDAVINVNLRSVFLVSKEAILLMMREKYGRIVNMSSIVGLRGNVGQANYAASKAGIIGLTKTLAAEVAKRNITVNAVAPGFIDTDMTKAVSDKAREEFLKLIPMEKAGLPEDIAEAVAFLASDRAKYITGQVIVVDGGLMLR
ncbi:MAG TPA: 3-oxoacyl-[acyl-carrier-protein] reductase [Spirochaetota bacterium]|nr:3-oxoacyl-[acyl-carrier-protein] reductase [Spirochaetota bacterium]HOL56699.1 3-oxoacyl-[acyl-carrier-protein] reductase [Spirochaetota bacterium]HPP04114.1 3-oxoacyl-[acyl-carrier-protein] reductase [Spirochaetota bacterium]